MTNLLLDAWAAVTWKACWQGSLVVLAVWLICLVIPSMPARCRCWLWRLAILKFMVVLLLPTLVNLPLLPAPSPVIPDYQPQLIPDLMAVSVVPAIPIQDKRMELPSLRTILFFVWIICVGCCFIHLMADWRNVRRLRKRSRVVDDVASIERLNSQARDFGLRYPPALLETEGNGSPMHIGIVRPAIVVPGGTLRRLSPPELAMVLGHELAHIRRGDLLWGLAAAGVQAVFFFHPLVWFGQRRLHLAQEIAADETAVLRQHGDPASYGNLLVSVVSKIGPGSSIPAMAMGTAGSVNSLTRRLVAMNSFGRASRQVIVSSGVLLAATVLLGIVPWRLVAAEPKDNTERENTASVKDSTEQRPSRGDKSLAHARLAFWPFSPLALRPFPKDYVSAWDDNRGPFYNAEIKIIERKKGQPEKVVAAPQLRFSAGSTACCSFVADCPFDDEHSVMVLTVSSSADKQPVQHGIEAKLLRHGVVMASKMTLVAGGIADKATGKTTTTAADGSELVVLASICPVKMSKSTATVPSRNPKTASTESKVPVASTWGFAMTGKDVSIIPDREFEMNGPNGKVAVKMPMITWSDRLTGEKVNHDEP
ncbi:MAG: M56 family metallopeptidase [Thermoguttaceae bacterium]